MKDTNSTYSENIGNLRCLVLKPYTAINKWMCLKCVGHKLVWDLSNFISEPLWLVI